MDNVKICQVMGDPIRYKILMMLIRSTNACCPVVSINDKESRLGLCNCEIMSELGMIQSRVSYHMKELVESGLVNEEPRGKWKYYFANRENLRDYIEQLRRDFSLD